MASDNTRKHIQLIIKIISALLFVSVCTYMLLDVMVVGNIITKPICETIFTSEKIIEIKSYTPGGLFSSSRCIVETNISKSKLIWGHECQSESGLIYDNHVVCEGEWSMVELK